MKKEVIDFGRKVEVHLGKVISQEHTEEFYGAVDQVLGKQVWFEKLSPIHLRSLGNDLGAGLNGWNIHPKDVVFGRILNA